MAVTLYRQLGKGNARRYQKVNLGRGRRPADLTGPYFLRCSLADSTRPWEHVGDDVDEAIAARECKQAYLDALNANVPVLQDRSKVVAGFDLATRLLSDGFVDEMESSSRLFSGMAGLTRKGRPLQRTVPRDEAAFGVLLVWCDPILGIDSAYDSRLQ
jgi:hypothetical protein